MKVGCKILEYLGLRQRHFDIISCPSCGRAQVDVIELAKQVTDGLKDIKAPIRVAVMGCIVNGPGEMADADYGYVGAARGRISLYRGKECVEMNIPEAEAVDKLLALIENDRKNFE